MVKYILIIAIAFLFLLGFLFKADSEIAPKPPNSLQISVFNLNYVNLKAKQVSRQIILTNPDIALILEWNSDNVDLGMLKEAAWTTHITYPSKGSHGLALLSQRDVKLSAEVVQSPIGGNCRMPLGVSRVSFQGEALSLLGIHAPPPVLACGDENETFLKALSEYVSDGKLKKAIGPGQAGDWAVLYGDFNQFSFRESVSRFGDLGFIDLYSAMRGKPGPTWGPLSFLPGFARIDLILIPEQFVGIGSGTIVIPGSDHNGVYGDFTVELKHN